MLLARDFTDTRGHAASSLTDAALLDLLAGRDDRMLGTLYDRYCALVYTIALRITGDRLSAEEVTQDVFQTVWQKYATYRPAAGTVAAWIIGITRHRAIDELRTRRHQAREQEEPIDESGLDIVDAGDGGEWQAVMRIDVRSALAALPAAQREVIQLAYYGGLTCAEMAASLAVPLGTVKTRLRLGLGHLRAVMAPVDERGEAGAV